MLTKQGKWQLEAVRLSTILELPTLPSRVEDRSVLFDNLFLNLFSPDSHWSKSYSDV